MDGIVIEGGFNDSDLNFSEKFTGNTVADILGRFGQKIQEDLVKSLNDKGKNATLNLSQSISFNINLFGDSVEFSLSLANYYKWVDEGRKPGKMPPIESIRKWLRVKSVFGGIGQSKKDLAFAIAKKIGKFGIKPSNFYSDVINDGRLKKLEEELSNAAYEDIKGVFISL